MKIWVDDLRTPPESEWVWYKNSGGFILAMENMGEEWVESLELVSLDHDLGGDDTSRPIVMWFCEHDIWPVEVRVHSANPVGVEWLEGMIERYKP